MQKQGLKIVSTIVALLFFANSHGQVFEYRLRMADSLFLQKQYTQSLEIYREIFDGKAYSPAMLLKMAYIEEGLGQTAQSLHYLTVYYQLTRDDLALAKMEETAAKYGLDGYEVSARDRFLIILSPYRVPIVIVLTAATIFWVSRMYVLRRRKVRPYLALSFLLFTVCLLAVIVNTDVDRKLAIVRQAPAYLMSGPSPGSTLVAIVGEGHRLKVKDRNDVWLKVGWGEGEAYIKESQLIEVRL